MNLIAKCVNKFTDQRNGEVWFKIWNLTEINSTKTFGTLTWNSRWGEKKFCVGISNPIHPDLGLHNYAFFEDQSEALNWAREQIEGLSISRASVEAAIQQVRDNRYGDEMSDDFAYSNGKVDRWNKLERELENMLKQMV